MSLSTAMDMIYLSLLPYSEQSGIIKDSEHPSNGLNGTLPNGNTAYIIINNCEIGIIGYIETIEELKEKENKLFYWEECDYIVCCVKHTNRDIKEYGGAYIVPIIYPLIDESPAFKYQEWIDLERFVLRRIKRLCGIAEKPVIQVKNLAELSADAINYIKQHTSTEEENIKIKVDTAEDAYRLFNAEWSRLIFQNENSDRQSYLYSKALLVFVEAAEQLSYKALSAGDVNELSALIFSHEINTENINNTLQGYHYKQNLYLSLSVCWNRQGIRYKDEAINSLKRYLLYMFIKNNMYSGSVPAKSIYGFRKVTKYFLGALIGHTLNVTSPHEFNDPFDTPILELYDGKHLGDLIEKAYKGTLKVACFSNTIDNPLMWAHYADNHKGVCIKYHFDKSIKTTNRIYSSKVTGFRNIKYSSEDLEECSKSSIITMEDAFFLKGTDWEYEKECRFFCFDLYGTGSFDQYGDTSDCIEAVYFGLRCPEEDKKTIVQILSCKKYSATGTESEETETCVSTNKVEFFEMQINRNKFGELIPHRLEEREIEVLLM